MKTSVRVSVLAWGAVRVGTPLYGPTGAAAGASLAWMLGVAASGLALRRRTGAFLNPWSVLRIGACGATIGWIASRIETSGFTLLLEDGLLALLYLLLLVSVRELDRGELSSAVRAWLPRR